MRRVLKDGKWRRAALSAATCLALVYATTAEAAGPRATGESASTEWHQWRGPQRTAISTETGWRTDWTANPPKTLWKQTVGEGFSSVAVAKGKVYTMGWAGGKDTVWCLDAATGEKVWTHSYPCGTVDHNGTRCTPTVDGAVVYTLSHAGDLYCLEADTGKVVWNLNVSKQFGAKVPQWGFSCSPLVLGNALIIDVGPIVALNKASGQVIWKSGNDTAGYASPYAFQAGSATLIASFNAYGPIVVSAADGKILGRTQWKTAYDVNAVTPIVLGKTLFISSGYGTGAAVFEMGNDGLVPLWKKKTMKNHSNSCVLWNGYLYGFDGQVNEGPLACIDYKTGDQKWSESSLKAGALMLADGKLIVMSSKGELAAVEASPEGFKELGRTKVLTGTCWTTPVLSGGRIYCRNQGGDLVCLDVKAK